MKTGVLEHYKECFVDLIDRAIALGEGGDRGERKLRKEVKKKYPKQGEQQ